LVYPESPGSALFPNLGSRDVPKSAVRSVDADGLEGIASDRAGEYLHNGNRADVRTEQINRDNERSGRRFGYRSLLCTFVCVEAKYNAKSPKDWTAKDKDKRSGGRVGYANN
jgi:hypothetical protein